MTAGTPFDVVILDLTIRGGVGGLETVQRLLAIDPAVRAVVSSGYPDDASMSEHLVHGFKACLRKPYAVSALREVLDSLRADPGSRRVPLAIAIGVWSRVDRELS